MTKVHPMHWLYAQASVGIKELLADRFDTPEGSVLLLHNLRAEPVRIHVEVFPDGPYEPPTARLEDLELPGWGYRWIRLRRGTGP